MNRFKSIFKTAATPLTGGLLLLLWLSANLTFTGCKKERLFAHVDSIAEVPAQFHLFNAFSYADSMSFSIDGLKRQNVKQYAFSAYYPTLSAFNSNTGQPNSKLININDPIVKTQYANALTNSIFQFKQNTSYVLFTSSMPYDTVYTPKNTIIPQLIYYPEDVYHPYDGTTGMRMFNCTASQYQSVSLTISPNVGQGTSATLNPVDISKQPLKASDSYSTTQKGSKVVTLNLGTQPGMKLTFLPQAMADGRNYSFFVVGDPKNFIAGKERRPAVYMVEDGNPGSLKELALSSLVYSGVSSYPSITVVNGAYNIPGIYVAGANPSVGTSARFNDNTVTVTRWPVVFGAEDIGGVISKDQWGWPNVLMQRVASTYVAPGQYAVTMAPSNLFSPVYDNFTYNFEDSHDYTLFMMPNNSSDSRMGHIVIENSHALDASLFKLRIVNIMGGSTAVDVHVGSPSGPILIGGVAYGQASDYLSIKGTSLIQNLYVTAAGSTQPLFQTGANNRPMAMPFTSGNIGTIYLMGLLPGTTYSGDPGYYGPYVYSHSDAYLNDQFVLRNTQLFY